jgi:hypothetical protein
MAITSAVSRPKALARWSACCGTVCTALVRLRCGEIQQLMQTAGHVDALVALPPLA